MMMYPAGNMLSFQTINVNPYVMNATTTTKLKISNTKTLKKGDKVYYQVWLGYN